MNARFCSSCGASLAEGARFCSACGAPVGAAAAAAPPEAPEPAAAVAARPEPESAPAGDRTVFEFRPLVIRTLRECLFSILTLGLGFVGWWIARMGRRYVITTQRVEVIEGIATRRRTAIDLFRIEDFEVVEPFFLRMRGAGNLRIWSLDKSEPDLILEAVPNVQEVYERLRDLTREERTRNRVRVVEGG